MAVIGRYYTPNNEIDGAYFKIDKITIMRNEYELLETIDVGNGKMQDIVTYKHEDEGTATVRVYMDRDSRINLTRVVDTFQFIFIYDIDSSENPFVQAYKAIKSTDFIEDAVDA